MADNRIAGDRQRLGRERRIATARMGRAVSATMTTPVASTVSAAMTSTVSTAMTSTVSATMSTASTKHFFLPKFVYNPKHRGLIKKVNIVA